MDEKKGAGDSGLGIGKSLSPRPIIAYADGSSRGNPGPGGWGVVVVTADDEVVELGGAAGHTTNNRMEMMAVAEALARIQQLPGPVEIRTDSSYVINGITKWVFAWRKRGWRTVDGKDVLNRDLWETLARLTGERGTANKVSWKHVRGHAGEPGNERVDEIATGFATSERPDLYDGPLHAYPVPIFDAPPSPAGSAAPSRSKTRSAAKAYSYLSLIGGEVKRHATWPECESRVKGASGAKYKKAISADDEAEILRAWGVRLE